MSTRKTKQKRKALTDDQKLRDWGERLQKKADKLRAEDRISRLDYTHVSWNALQAMRPRDCAKVVGL